MSIERGRELRRRRHRTKKMRILKRRTAKASVSEKSVIAAKLRSMTPGCEVIIANWGLEEKR